MLVFLYYIMGVIRWIVEVGSGWVLWVICFVGVVLVFLLGLCLSVKFVDFVEYCVWLDMLRGSCIVDV